MEAIDRLRRAVIQYRRRVQGSLEGLDSQLRRAVDWIEHDRPSYWKRATRAAEEAIHNAKIDLERCLAFPLLSGERPSCREEKALVAECNARLQYCRGQRERVKNWQYKLDHEAFEYQGRVAGLRALLDADLEAAEQTLARIVRRLEDYAVEGAPVSQLNDLVGTADEPGATDANHTRRAAAGDASATGDAADAPANDAADEPDQAADPPDAQQQKP
ncbi:MAG: hypothetical protein CMJ58_17775 [Planctomycetaceae bacterium]|nr:hypothetical protein [Planctomycetaceae bacterium]